MTRKFCPRCGKSTDELHEGLCSECFLKKFEFSKSLPNKITTLQCKECGKFYNNEKSFASAESAIDDYFQNLKPKEIESVTYRISRDKLLATLHLNIDGIRKQEKKTMQFKQHKFICKSCTMRLTGYFTSIIQLRGKFDKNILDEIKLSVEKNKKHDELAFISKIVQKKEGTDLYFGSKTAANKVVKYLKTRYMTRTKFSRTLYGTKQGKSMYRDTILVSFEE